MSTASIKPLLFASSQLRPHIPEVTEIKQSNIAFLILTMLCAGLLIVGAENAASSGFASGLHDIALVRYCAGRESMSSMAFCLHGSCGSGFGGNVSHMMISCSSLKNDVNLVRALLLNASLMDILVVLFIMYSAEERLNILCVMLMSRIMMMAIRSFALVANLGRCQNTAKIDFNVQAQIYRVALVSFCLW